MRQRNALQSLGPFVTPAGCSALDCGVYAGPLRHKCSCVESIVQDAILIDQGSRPGVILYRNNRGVHRSERTTDAHLKRLLALIDAGDIAGCRALILDIMGIPVRYVEFGLTKGASDIIGTARNSGGLAVLIAIEVKRRHGPGPSIEQRNFLELVRRAGGFSGVARSIADAARIIDEALAS